MLEAITYTLALCAAPWSVLVLLVGYQIGAKSGRPIKAIDDAVKAVTEKSADVREREPAERPKDDGKRFKV